MPGEKREPSSLLQCSSLRAWVGMAAFTIRRDRLEEVVLFVELDHSRFQKKKKTTLLTLLTKLNLEFMDMKTALLLVRVDLTSKGSRRRVLMAAIASQEKNLQVWLILLQPKHHDRGSIHLSLMHCSTTLRKIYKRLRLCQA